jgi:hypothetical protein
MKTRSIFTSFVLKAFIVITCITGFAGIKCDAQSIIGKWHRAGTLSFKIDKATGKETPALTPAQQKQYDDATAANEYNEVLEFKSSTTYTSNISAKGRPATAHTGNYSLSGNNLNMNIPPVHNEKTTITIKSLDATTMVWDLVFMNELTRITYKRI